MSVEVKSPISKNDCFISKHNEQAFGVVGDIVTNDATCSQLVCIQGKAGVGKTFILKAIYSAIRVKNPDLSCAYIGAESMACTLCSSIKDNSYADFVQRFTNLDLLLIDDIQYLQGRNNTQVEVSFIIEKILSKKGIVVVACNSNPDVMFGTDERMRFILERSRATEIKCPQKGEKEAFLIWILKMHGIKVDANLNQLITYLADTQSCNLRELYRTIWTVIEYKTQGE